MEKMEPTIIGVSSEETESGSIIGEKEREDVSQEDIFDLCNESYLLRSHILSTLSAYLEKASSAEDFHYVIDAIDYLKRRVENEPHHELQEDDFGTVLESISQKNISYFVRENARFLLRAPLDSISPKRKKRILQNDFKNIVQEGVVRELFGSANVWDSDDLDALEDEVICRAFRLYGDMNPAYYRWMESGDMKSEFHEESLDRLYDISIGTHEAFEGRGWSYRRRLREQSILSRISNRFSVAYDASGAIDSFFVLDEATERKVQNRNAEFGSISEDHLKFFIEVFSSKQPSGESLLRYVQIRSQLPEALTQSFEERFLIVIPNELKKSFDTLDDFEKDVSPWKEKIFEVFSDSERARALQFLSENLSHLLQERMDTARQDNFGFASENAENSLDFFLSCVEVDPKDAHPTAHHTLCYYFFLREKLPPELVHEFESRFDIHVPEHLKSFATYDDYLKSNDKELLSVLCGGKWRIKEIMDWMSEEAEDLAGKVRALKIRPEKISFSEILKEEGLEENANDEVLESRYRFLLQPIFRKKIEDDFGIELKDFSVRTQVQFLNFLFEKNEEEVRKVIAFLKNVNSENRLKSFLSLEQGGAEMGEKILAIGEKLPKEAADRVFAKYAEMAERANEVRKNSEKNADAIETKLLERGKSLLSWIAKHAEEFSHDGKLLSALEERLESLNAETILAVNALRAAKESGNAEGIQEFLDGSFRILKGSDLSAKTIAEMESLYRMSYPSDLEEQFREKLVKDLREKKISDPSARFYAFFMGEQGKESLKAFCSFQDDISDGSVYFGAFNVDEFFSGEKMGCLMMDESLEREAKECVVRAACIPEKPISEHYIEKRGFVGKSFSDLEGIDLLSIERDDKNAGHYETKRMTQEDVIRKAEASFKGASQIFLSVSERSLSRESIEANVKDGFALTRMFRRGEGEGAKVYLAFENEK